MNVISEKGVRLLWRTIPWSEVVDVPPAPRWDRYARLVRRDGKEVILMGVEAGRIPALRSLARTHGARFRRRKTSRKPSGGGPSWEV